ncbi:MAG: HAMP domain-containing protein [Actinobacteria bacterium]|nr:HAMP domain-containing protein [Actinomycetota bacterium]
MTHDSASFAGGTPVPAAGPEVDGTATNSGIDVPVDSSGTAVVDATQNRSGRRGLTIRLKLTLWYGGLFLLAGILLITINFLMVRDSLNPAPEKARAAVAERFGIPPEALEFGGPFGPAGVPGEFQRYVTINGIPLPRLLDEAQKELRHEALQQLWIRSVLALAIMAVITFGLAWLLAGRMLKPLHAITSTARRLSESTLHERIALRGPRDELKELADTFDAMLARLDTAFSAQKEFVANASHELRTPLTIIRTELDVALADPNVSQDEL